MAYDANYPADNAYVKDIPAAIRLKGEELIGTQDGPIVDADKTDGFHASATPAADTIVVADATGKIAVGYLDLTGYVPTTRTLTAGNGISTTGLGALSSNRTVNMATPATLDHDTVNSAPSQSGHTHQVNFPRTGFFDEDLTESTTTSTSYVTASSFTIPIDIPGVYHVQVWGLMKSSSTSGTASIRVYSEAASRPLAGTTSTTLDDVFTTSATSYSTFFSDNTMYFGTAGNKTITVLFKSSSSGYTAYTDNVYINVHGGNILAR